MTTAGPHLTDAQAQLLVDGLLAPGDAAALERHVAGCAGCGRSVDAYRALASALDGLEAPPLPDRFTAGVLARIDAAEIGAARERRQAFAILAAVVAASAAAFATAGASAWAPYLSTAAGTLAGAARAFEVVARVVPTLVSALRLEILLVAAALALPLLLALLRLVAAFPPPDAEAA